MGMALINVISGSIILIRHSSFLTPVLWLQTITAGTWVVGKDLGVLLEGAGIIVTFHTVKH